MSEGVTQKEFYEAMAKMTKKVSDLTVAMTETTTLIRDYNGLRKTIGDVDNRVQKLENNSDNKKDYRAYIGWLVGIVSTGLVIYMQLK